jgi:hypothetical protein
MSPVATGQLDPQPTWFQVQNVMYHNEFTGGKREFAQEAF